MDLVKRAKELGVPLNKAESKFIQAAAVKLSDGKGDASMSVEEWHNLVSHSAMARNEKLTIYEYLSKSIVPMFGQQLLQKFAAVGISFFAIVGAHTAGEAGMHVAGATLVGCVIAIGGGTLNAMIMGSAPAA